MHICFVTPEFVSEESCFDGGLSNYLFRVSLGLIEMGHVPMIIVSSDVSEIIFYQSIEVHRVNVKQLNYSTALNWLNQSFVLNEYLEKIVLFQKIDIIQYSSFMGVGFYRIESIPTVVRLSSYHPFLSIGHDIQDSKENQNCNYIEIASIRNADAVYGPSKLISNEISSIENIKVNVIESPFVQDTIVLDFSLSEQLSGEKYLLYFGSLSLLKGIKTIAEVLNELFSNHNDLFFVFLGKDTGFNGRKMMDYVYENAGNYRDKIYYYEKMNHKSLYPFIKNAYAVVLPSRIDNFPNTCIEAMAHGKIVIGTKNTGFDQLIEDGISGYLCEKDNSKELLQTIEKVLSLSEGEIKYLQTNASRRIELLKPQYVVKELLDFFSVVIEKHYKNGALPVETKNKKNFFLWDNIFDLDNRIKENTNTILDQTDVIKSLINSNRYKIGKFIIKPFSLLKREWINLNKSIKKFHTILRNHLPNIDRNKNKVSVIITCYKEGDLIHRAFKSLNDQTDKEFSILLVYDASNDHVTESICRYYEGSFNIPVIWNKKNVGLSEARNIGVNKATGEIIVFLDADDTLPANAIEVIKKEFLQHPDADFIYGNYFRNDIETDIKSIVDCSVVTDNIGMLSPSKLILKWVLLGTSPMKKAFFQRNNGYAIEFSNTCQDVDFWMRSLLRGAKGYYTNNCIYNWYRSDSGMNNSAKNLQDLEKCNISNHNFFIQFHPDFQYNYNSLFKSKNISAIKNRARLEISHGSRNKRNTFYSITPKFALKLLPEFLFK